VIWVPRKVFADALAELEGGVERNEVCDRYEWALNKHCIAVRPLNYRMQYRLVAGLVLVLQNADRLPEGLELACSARWSTSNGHLYFPGYQFEED